MRLPVAPSCERGVSAEYEERGRRARPPELSLRSSLACPSDETEAQSRRPLSRVGTGLPIARIPGPRPVRRVVSKFGTFGWLSFGASCQLPRWASAEFGSERDRRHLASVVRTDIVLVRVLAAGFRLQVWATSTRRRRSEMRHRPSEDLLPASFWEKAKRTSTCRNGGIPACPR